jgi:hypothetical protein
MKITKERYFVISSLDQAGQLARVNAVLMEQRVDCSGIWGFPTLGRSAEITVLPRNPELFLKTASNAGWNFSEGYCFHLEGSDRTGALVDILKQLADDGINLRAVDAMAVEGKFACCLWVADHELEHVSQVLGLSTPKP